ncbi:unnamed protein product [Gongylonema pulchrum]|uniref:Uncharacterized protein n=1 Tax=Gongylonema pulchrum TaxID=637853 RepID=A0A183CY34_9BILA|nr:unnamed protein product [Gongylonema pulchrum]
MKARLRLWKRENSESEQEPLLAATFPAQTVSKSGSTTPSNPVITSSMKTGDKSEVTTAALKVIGNDGLVQQKAAELPLHITTSTTGTAEALDEVLETQIFGNNYSEELELNATDGGGVSEQSTTQIYLVTKRPEFDDLEPEVRTSRTKQIPGLDRTMKITGNVADTVTTAGQLGFRTISSAVSAEAKTEQKEAVSGTVRSTPTILRHGNDHDLGSIAAEMDDFIQKSANEKKEQTRMANHRTKTRPEAAAGSTGNVRGSTTEDETLKSEHLYPHVHRGGDVEELFQKKTVTPPVATTTPFINSTTTVLTEKPRNVTNQFTTPSTQSWKIAGDHFQSDFNKGDNAVAAITDHGKDDNSEQTIRNTDNNRDASVNYSDDSNAGERSAEEETTSPALERKTSTLRVERGQITSRTRKSEIQHWDQESMWKRNLVPWWLVAIFGSLVATFVGSIAFKIIKTRFVNVTASQVK